MKRTAALLFSAMLVAALLAGCGEDEFQTFPFTPREYYITNVRESRSMLRSEVVVDAYSTKYVEALQEKVRIVDATIVQFLAELNADTLNAPGAMTALGAELALELNRALGHDYVHRVFLTYYMHG
jgi:flagellar basal body-associated protein FliL